MRYSDFSGKRAFKYDELKHELADEDAAERAKNRGRYPYPQNPAPAPAPANEIKMVALHYLNIDAAKAQEYIDSGVKLKQDRHGAWYLPRYNKSGRVYQEQLARLKADNVVSRTNYIDKSYLTK